VDTLLLDWGWAAPLHVVSGFRASHTTPSFGPEVF